MNKQKNIANQCLSLEALANFREKLLSGKDLQLASGHMSECEFCSDLGKTLNPVDLPIINSIAANVNNRISTITGYASTKESVISLKQSLLILLVFLSAIILYFFLSNNLNKPENKNTFLPIITKKSEATLQLKQNPAESSLNSKDVNVKEQNQLEKQVSATETKELPTAIEEPNTIVETKTTITENKIDNLPQKEAVTNDVAIQNTTNKNNTSSIKKYNQQLIVSVELISKMSDIKMNDTRRGSSKNGDIGSSRSSKTDGFYLPDEMPDFYGGDDGLKEYMKDKITALLKDNAALRQKTITVEFIVTAKGKIEDPSMAKGISKEADELVLQEIKKMPNWKPATKRKGDIRCMLAISFD